MKPMRIWMLFLLIPLLSCTDQPRPAGSTISVEAETALRQAPSWELFSLNPYAEFDESDPETFHGWKVLGSLDIQDDAVRQRLLKTLEESVAANSGQTAACFMPRHGIRASYHNQQFDFVICFQCYHVKWYRDGSQQTGFHPTDTPSPAFNAVLKQAEVPLPEQADLRDAQRPSEIFSAFTGSKNRPGE